MIFDLKHQYNISGMRIIGWYKIIVSEKNYVFFFGLVFSDNQSTPRSGHIDVSNAVNGPWLKVKDFTCPLSRMFY